jgi:indolepyruvate ferredoxin oxidoreductase alpha subunit
VNSRSPVTVFILDNGTTAMTGGQESAAYGRIEDICKGVGVEPEHIHTLRPLKKHHEENVRIIQKELAYPGVSVIIPRRECVVAIDKRMRDKYRSRNIKQQ